MRWHMWKRGARRARPSSPCRAQAHDEKKAAVQRLVEAATASEQLNLKLGTGPAWSILHLELAGLCALTTACSRLASLAADAWGSATGVQAGRRGVATLGVPARGNCGGESNCLPSHRAPAVCAGQRAVSNRQSHEGEPWRRPRLLNERHAEQRALADSRPPCR